MRDPIRTADAESSIEVTGAGAGGAQLIDELLDRSFRWLQFPGALEGRFVEEYLQKWRKHEVVSATFALLLFDSFLLTDQQMIPDIYAFAVKVRLGIVTPLILLGILMHVRGWAAPIRQAYMALISVLCGCTLIWFQSLTHSEVAAYYFIGLPLIVIYSNVVQRLRFWYALAATVTTIGFCFAWESRISVVPMAALQAFGLVVFTTGVLTLIASYRFEFDERLKFLLRMRDELQRERERELMRQLGKANLKLQQLSNTDPLTAIPNRRHFDERLAELWESCALAGAPLALLLFDVDHFKFYNDHYGHPAGDECLRHIAAAAKSALRTPGDVLARYGGEEFAVILPMTDEGAATEIAERLRRAITTLGLPHDRSPVAPTVTISIGVATAMPGSRTSTRNELLQLSDKLLYKAKLAGRNRVWNLSSFSLIEARRSVAA